MKPAPASQTRIRVRCANRKKPHGVQRRARAAGAPPLVLIVGEPSDLLDMYAEYLRFHGLRVHQTASGERAVEIALVAAPEVIVMDLDAPVAESAPFVPESDSREGLAVIRFRPEARVEARGKRSEDAVQIVAKPCPPERLLSACSRAERRTARRA